MSTIVVGISIGVTGSIIAAVLFKYWLGPVLDRWFEQLSDSRRVRNEEKKKALVKEARRILAQPERFHVLNQEISEYQRYHIFLWLSTFIMMLFSYILYLMALSIQIRVAQIRQWPDTVFASEIFDSLPARQILDALNIPMDTVIRVISELVGRKNSAAIPPTDVLLLFSIFWLALGLAVGLMAFRASTKITKGKRIRSEYMLLKYPEPDKDEEIRRLKSSSAGAE